MFLRTSQLIAYTFKLLLQNGVDLRKRRALLLELLDFGVQRGNGLRLLSELLFSLGSLGSCL
jgi:hypothetical protein